MIPAVALLFVAIELGQFIPLQLGRIYTSPFLEDFYWQSQSNPT
jgi:hypothetical protein